VATSSAYHVAADMKATDAYIMLVTDRSYEQRDFWAYIIRGIIA